MTGQRALYLYEYQPESELIVKEHFLHKPKFSAIDAHGHFGGIYSDIYRTTYHNTRVDVHQAVAELKQHGIRRVVNLDGFWTGFMALELEKVLDSLQDYEDFFINFVSVDTRDVDNPDFEKKTVYHLNHAKDLGFAGIKLFKHVSLMVEKGPYNFVPGRNIRIDDKRLKVIWETAAGLNMPVLIHIGDPKAFFKPVDGRNERYEELLNYPDWSYAKPGMYTFEEMLEMQENLLSENPNTTFIIAHVGSCSEDLAYVSKCLDRYPNMYIDIAERISELGRQPYTSREFFNRYQDRILFGTDAYPGQMHKRYPPYFRFLETFDEYFDYSSYNCRWKIYGIGLEDEVLKKVYYKNAERVLNIL